MDIFLQPMNHLQKHQIIKLCDLTIDHLDNFIEEKTLKLLLLVHK